MRIFYHREIVSATVITTAFKSRVWLAEEWILMNARKRDMRNTYGIGRYPHLPKILDAQRT